MFFCPQSRAKNVRACYNFGLPLHSLHTVFSKEIAAENLVKIALELSVLEPIQQGVFFVPNPDRKMYVPDKILGCLYLAFILTSLKKLKLKIW